MKCFHLNFFNNDDDDNNNNNNNNNSNNNNNNSNHNNNTDIIRMRYKNTLCMGLSTGKVEKIIKIVLEKLAGVECDRLPKVTFSKYMLIKTTGMAQF